jgi:ferric-dicitrate binding protein FerR (iron transport regulator)
MNKQAFNALLQRYLNGSCTAQERMIVEQWFEAWKEDRPQSAVSDEEWKHIADRMWYHIQQQIHQPDVPVIPIKSLRGSLWLQIAASVLLLVAFLSGWYYLNQFSDEKFRITNTSTKPKQLLLPDGSKVILYAGSRLHFPDFFADTVREVLLEGDAFFDVTYRATQPFYVKTNNLTIKVLGTSFFVRTTEKTKTEVAVRTGRVAVSERYSDNEKNNGVLLTPNQKVVYYAEQQHFVTALVEKPIPVAAVIPAFNYTEAPLGQVIEDLQATYQVQIILENNRLADCNLTGNLSQMDMYAQLDAVTQAIGASYQIKGTTILIIGQGC